jgi:hypothetical protein
MDAAELARRRYLYRRLIVNGQLRVSRAAAVPLVGPDCAYHLYAWPDDAPSAARARAQNRGVIGGILVRRGRDDP